MVVVVVTVRGQVLEVMVRVEVMVDLLDCVFYFLL